MSILLPIYAGGSATPAFGFQNHNYTSAGSSSESGIICKTDGKFYEKDGVSEIERFNQISPPHKAGYIAFSVYLLSVGMETGDTVGTWYQIGGSGGAQRSWGITSSGFTRNNTLYYSWGVRSGTTLGAFDGSVTSTVNVP